MCGIAGVMTTTGRPPTAAQLHDLSVALSHRGPDGDGQHNASDVGMIQTRLAIIDLETGDQPLYEPGGAALVANGEIYNYIELQTSLRDAGVALATGSDCEPILHLYRRDGLDFVNSLRGMYAIAIHDPTEGRLVLSRDPFGIKPLYFVETAGHFAFASEAQALQAAGLAPPPAIDPRHRDELLQLQFTCGPETIMEGIQRLMPGETIVVRGGRIVERRHKPALPDTVLSDISESDAVDALEKALTDSVLVHQRSDVPYGLFLSGGIDSSAILALMAKLNSSPVTAFTAGFPGSDVTDERDRARELARLVGADHHEVTFDEDDFWSLLPTIAGAMDDPAADYATLPTWKLAETAAQSLKVVLCGEGGDELFAGYGRYRSVLRPWILGGRTVRHRGAFDRLDVLRDKSDSWRDGIASTAALSASQGRSKLQIAQAIDCTDWLSQDLLTKLDRCLMAHGLEGRTPFLDPAVAAASFALPDRLKIRKGLGKWILRKWLSGVLPESDAFTRKRGFTVPVGVWIGNRADKLGPLMEQQESLREICKPGTIAPLLKSTGKRAGFAAWILLFYALWHKRHIEQVDTRGANILDALAS
ncbi:MAG: asparagine synthase (glutamine-hydrolyzing) [Alphaproteobacteria bacterium]